MTTPTEVKKYELMVILSGDVTDGDLEKEVDNLRKTLSESTKGITYEDIWGRKDMMYKIKRQKRGYYAIFVFNAEPTQLVELRTTVKLNPLVLRHLLISLPEDHEPGKYKTVVLPEAELIEKSTSTPSKSSPMEGRKEKKSVKEVAVEPEKPKLETHVAGKAEEEELKTVEKKLEKILENPDIDIK
jgi:small subunit ribosomal protein S6